MNFFQSNQILISDTFSFEITYRIYTHLFIKIQPDYTRLTNTCQPICVNETREYTIGYL